VQLRLGPGDPGARITGSRFDLRHPRRLLGNPRVELGDPSVELRDPRVVHDDRRDGTRGPHQDHRGAAKQVVARAWPIRVYIKRRAVVSGGSSSGPVNPYRMTFRQMTTAPRALRRSAAARAP
jgi:hypothetical protein